VSFGLGYCVNFLLNFLMNSIAFWTLETFAVQMMVRWISDLLSGQIIPLIFFPGVWRQVMLGLPFAAIYSTPLLIYVGTIGPQHYAAALLLQAVWLVVFAGAAAVMWHAAQRRVVVQGG
jgi:ABC-2 type transport system permease protein